MYFGTSNLFCLSIFLYAEPSFRYVKGSVKVYLALVTERKSHGVCIYWARRHPENQTFNIEEGKGMTKVGIQLHGKLPAVYCIKCGPEINRFYEIVIWFNCILVGKPAVELFSWIILEGSPLSVAAVIRLLKTAVRLGLAKIHVVTSLVHAKEGLIQLPVWANQKYYTAPKSKGHKVRNIPLWNEIHQFSKTVTVSWNFEGQESKVFRRVSQTAAAHAIAS